MIFLPIDMKQCDKMLEYEKGYIEKGEGVPPHRYTHRHPPQGPSAGF
jgi:hypothetical protein